MEPHISVHNLELTPRLRQYVQKKTERLDRYLPNLMDVRVDLAMQQYVRSADDRNSAQLTVRDKRGTILRAEEVNADIFAAVDCVIDKMYRQISRYRDKRITRRHKGFEDAEVELLEPLPIELEPTMYEDSSVVRIKRFEALPMTSDEAVEQMELLGHDFYVFFNAIENEMNVLYRRRDGNYGLLQPELG